MMKHELLKLTHSSPNMLRRLITCTQLIIAQNEMGALLLFITSYHLQFSLLI